MEIATVGTPALWLGFTALVLALLAVDLGVFHRGARAVGVREAAAWSGMWIALALAFNGFVWWAFGPERGTAFFAGYLIEKALAVDNIFVFYAVFSYFAVPAAYQHRVLFWGILGALVMRGGFIFLGAALIQQFHFVTYLLGGVLLVTAVKLFTLSEEGMHPERNRVYRLVRRVVPSVPTYHGGRFTVVKDGRRHATPLLLALLLIEWTDVVFAVDSIPAIFAVTSDPFIVYTSNIFAILGLRSLFFVLAGFVGSFHLLKPCLAGVLAFVGAKMLAADVFEVPLAASLAVVAGLIAIGILGSLAFPQRAVAPVPVPRPGPPAPGA